MSELRALNLKVENLSKPESLEVAKPRFYWQCATLSRNWYQKAYQLVVASSRENLRIGTYIWDSGRVESGRSWEVEYNGPELGSVRTYHWMVKVWGKDGSQSDWSEPSAFTTGYLKADDWKASWIGLDQPNKEKEFSEDRRLPAYYLRREFKAIETIQEARLVICGLGYFYAEVNGSAVSSDELVPDLTDYRKRAIYYSYDVTDLLQQGDNALGVALGNSRYYGPRFGDKEQAITFGLPRVICQLHIRYESGREEIILSDDSWGVSMNGPIIENNDYDGEIYDARKEFKRWSLPSFNDETWTTAEVVSPPKGKLEGNRAFPCRVTRRLKPISMIQPKADMFVLDMGQNMVGVVEMTLRGRPGQKVTLRFAENINDDGTINVANMRGAKVTDTYTFADFKKVTWRPRFTYHGFRYVEVTGLDVVPDMNAFTGLVIHSDLEEGGHFSCSNTMLSKLYRNTLWGIRGNLRSIPTDCPQRDERQGWLGDIANESKGESYDFNAVPFFEKWLQDIMESQREDGALSDVAPAYWPLYTENATWPAAYVLTLEWLYDHCGNKRAIEKHYDSVKKWILHLYEYVEEGIFDKDQYGDWCVPPSDPWLIHSEDPSQITSKGVLGTCYMHRLSSIALKFARLLERNQDFSTWEKVMAETKEGLLKRYWNEGKGCIDNGTQTSSILPLFFNMVEGEKREALLSYLLNHIKNLSNNHVNTGIIGLQWMMRLLSLNGEGETAFILATQKDYPSWGYMIENDATTVWELWNGNTANPDMNSLNHLMLIGDFHLWLYEHVAGIRPDTSVPAFQRFHLKPDFLSQVDWAAGKIDTPCGMISSHWRKENGKIRWKVKIPENSTATIWLPSGTNDNVYLDDELLTPEKLKACDGADESEPRLELGSGVYVLGFENGIKA